uniref:DNA-(apurinic or apyrimidinic site) endonuclease 2 n=1 Tax=Triticum urartu TaxID=4572 RepID=A0A8R7UKD0_TRIUA
MVKIVTYNVNGLRPRVAQHGSLRRLLDSLDADIICFQETKLSRQDLSGDVIMAEGYEAFISCNRSSRGRGPYSGVATFCRVTSAFASQEVALPVAAEEGFAGLQGSAKDNEVIGDFVLDMPMDEEDLGEITREELLRVDNEGRCIITDHGHFVLFNIYGPSIGEDDEERVRFKLLFYKILQKRWEFLLALGKRVFVVGDLNIAPSSIDRCDASPGFEKQMFREWLRSMLREHGGPFFDAFRSKHPERTGAYTCFNQKVGAEEYNYGSRIDHILISGACFHDCNSVEDHSIFHCHVEDCEIMNHFRRGDSGNISKWKGGRSSKLEGSDHIPVYMLLNGIPELPAHNTPPSAARYLPEIRGRQQSIVSFLSKRKLCEAEDGPGLNISRDRENQSCCSDDLERRSISKEELATGITEFSKGVNQPSPTSKRRNLDHWINEGSSGSSVTLLAAQDDSLQENIQCTAAADGDPDNSNISSSLSTYKCNIATLEWQRIQQRMKMTLPLCKGHREPCIPRSVKKGSNIGRLFYVCARAQGPSSNPEANCNHFQWASVKSKGKRQ